MRINSVKKLTALVLTGAAVAVAAETGSQAVAALSSGSRPLEDLG